MLGLDEFWWDRCDPPASSGMQTTSAESWASENLLEGRMFHKSVIVAYSNSIALLSPATYFSTHLPERGVEGLTLSFMIVVSNRVRLDGRSVWFWRARQGASMCTRSERSSMGSQPGASPAKSRFPRPSPSPPLQTDKLTWIEGVDTRRVAVGGWDGLRAW